MSDPSYAETARFLANQSSPDPQPRHTSSPAHPSSRPPLQQRRSHSPNTTSSLFPRPSSRTGAQDRISFRTQWPSTNTISADGVRARWAQRTSSLVDRADAFRRRFSPLQQALLGVAGVVAFVLSILFLVYNGRIFAGLVPLVEAWRKSKVGWLVLWVMVFGVSFPPMIGYSTLFTLAGFVFGVWKGWAIVASATVAGSTASFLVSRYFLRSFVERLTARDRRFEALALTLKHDGLKLLVMIRLCPLPYSLSNGAISTIPTVTPLQMALATAIASPKLLIGIFIGSRLGGIAEGGDKMDFKAKIVSYISIVVGIAIGVGTGWFMYTKTQQRARELQALERQHGGSAGAGRGRRDVEQGLGEDDFEYEDDPSERVAANEAIRGADGISLHTQPEEEDYRDDAFAGEEEGEADASSLDAVFRAGDGDSGSEAGAYKDEDEEDNHR